MLPDWIPNIHPLIIHFPIVLIPLACAVHGSSILFKQLEQWAFPLGVFYSAGSISALAAFFSGRQAADAVAVLPQANPILSEHADLALWTLSISVLAAILYWLWYRIRKKSAWHWPALGINLIAAGLMVVTADHGGRLVYRFGTGVTVKPVHIEENHTDGQSTGLIRNEDGSWVWTPGNQGLENGFPDLHFQAGKAEHLNLAAGEIGSYRVKDLILFTLGDPVGDVQVEATLDLTGFKGSAAIIHHYKNLDQFDFLEIDSSKIILGRQSQGGKVPADEQDVKTEGWFTMTAVASGRHFRGYIDENLIIHGHTAALEPGFVGLRIKGEGIIGLKSIKVIPLKENKNEQ